ERRRAPANAAHPEGAPAVVQKQGVRASFAAPLAAARGDEHDAAVFEIALQGRACRATQQPDAFLVSLAHDAQLAASQVEVGHARPGQLRDAQAGGVGRLPEGAIALCEGRGTVPLALRRSEALIAATLIRRSRCACVTEAALPAVRRVEERDDLGRV